MSKNELSAKKMTLCTAWVVLVVLAGCASHGAPQQQGPAPLSVTLGKVMRGDIATIVTFDGQVSPVYQTTLSTAEAGTVASLNVTEGDFVHKGQLLASLDTSQLQANLHANLAAVREGEAQLRHSALAAPVNAQQYSSAVTLAQQNLRSAENAVSTAQAALVSDELTEKADYALLQQQYLPRVTYEQARANAVSARETLQSNEETVTAQQAALRTALSNTNQRLQDQATIDQNRASLDAARANVELLTAQITQASITAPFDGQVTQRLLDAGAYAGASTGILELSQLSRVYVVANVPDVDLDAVQKGAGVTFTTTSLPGRVFHGRVFDVNLTPTSGTLSYRVRILQPNPDLALRGGMLVSVNATAARHEHVLLVPSAAVVKGPSVSQIFTVVDGKAKMIPVQVGLQTDTTAEVRGPGLEPGASVITSQPLGLHEGSTIAPPAPPLAAHGAGK